LDTSNAKIKVLYIAGATRSGSTLLARLLGEADGFVNVGEALRWVFNTEMMSRETPCGCGSAVFNCPFWEDILSSIENSPIQKFSTKAIRIRYLPLLMFPIKLSKFQEKWEDLISTTEKLLEDIIVKSDARVIVDSSKNPANAYVLSNLPNVQLYIVHLIRDPRGVASSWSKRKSYLKAFPTTTVTWWWLSYNLSAEILRAYAKKFIVVRYEDFVQRPEKTLREIIRGIDETPAGTRFIKGDQVQFGIQHVIASNPDKLSSDRIKIRENQWQLPLSPYILVSILTLPLLLRYQYSLLGGLTNSIK
jgi:hypothetical protein